MLDARFSQLYFGPSLNTLHSGLPAIAGLLVHLPAKFRINRTGIQCVNVGLLHHFLKIALALAPPRARASPSPSPAVG